MLCPDLPLRVEPPEDPTEDPLDDVSDAAELRGRLQAIVTRKADQVAFADGETLIAADTVVADGVTVFGQPPEETLRETLHAWMRRLGGRTHQVMTAVEVRTGDRIKRAIATTQVTMRPYDAATVDWYVATGEPLGKAGGYAVQGLGSVLIERVEGSLTNVIGLPLETLRTLLSDLDSGPTRATSSRR